MHCYQIVNTLSTILDQVGSSCNRSFGVRAHFCPPNVLAGPLFLNRGGPGTPQGKILLRTLLWPQHSFSDYGLALILVVRVKHVFQMVSFNIKLWPQDSFSVNSEALILVIRVKCALKMVSFYVRLGIVQLAILSKPSMLLHVYGRNVHVRICLTVGGKRSRES